MKMKRISLVVILKNAKNEAVRREKKGFKDHSDQNDVKK
jgi:hypothetical protein